MIISRSDFTLEQLEKSGCIFVLPEPSMKKWGPWGPDSPWKLPQKVSAITQVNICDILGWPLTSLTLSWKNKWPSWRVELTAFDKWWQWPCNNHALCTAWHLKILKADIKSLSICSLFVDMPWENNWYKIWSPSYCPYHSVRHWWMS